VVVRTVSPAAIDRAPARASLGGGVAVGLGPWAARTISRVVTSRASHDASTSIDGKDTCALTSYNLVRWVIRAVAVRSTVVVAFSFGVSVTATSYSPRTSPV
jgi:hypothetical protein